MQDENEKKGNVEQNLTKNFEKQIELTRRIEAIKEETYQKIKNDPKVLEFLQPYNSLFYDSFFTTYAIDKARWYVFKDSHQKEQEIKAYQFLKIAKAGLECLQKMKMYDLRREWGAGLVDFPDMKTPFDFMLKCDDVFALDWIPPITGQEVDILKAYVQQSTTGELSFLLPYEASEFSMPFILHEDSRIGMRDSFCKYYQEKTDRNLQVLPDKRGKKAQMCLLEYNRVVKEEEDAKIARGEMEPPKEFDTRPVLPTGKSWFLEEFIKKFDTKETLYNYRLYKSQNDPLNEEDQEDDENAPLFSVKERIEAVLNKVVDLDVILPIKGNADWRIALIDAYNAYERQRVIEAIDQAYDEYLFHVSSGIQFMSSDIKPRTIKQVNLIKEKVLKGWEMLGETGEMDFR